MPAEICANGPDAGSTDEQAATAPPTSVATSANCRAVGATRSARGGPADDEMGGALARHGLGKLVAEGLEVESGPQRLAGVEQDGPQDDVQVVHQPGLEILAHGARAATDANVLAVRGTLRLLERVPDPAGDEVEHGAALHLERLAGVMGEHERRDVVRR